MNVAHVGFAGEHEVSELQSLHRYNEQINSARLQNIITFPFCGSLLCVPIHS